MPDLDDLGIDPWGDLGQLPDTVIQTPDPELAGELDGLIQDQIGGGGDSSFFSIITDDHSYIVSTSSPFVVKGSTSGSGSTTSWTNYNAPSQIGSGSENMFGTTKLLTYQSYQSGVTFSQYFSFSNITLSCELEVPKNSEKVNFDGSLSFLYGTASSASGPVTPSTVSRSAYTVCKLTILGQSYPGVYDSANKVFNFETSDIDISTLTSSLLPISISFSNSSNSYVQTASTSQTYIGIRFMFSDSLNPHFTISEPSGGFDEESKGLLRTIVDGVRSIVTGIIELPGKIASAILDGLKALFVPSAEEITAIKQSYEDLLSERLGFIWQAGEMVISFGQSVLSAFETATDFQFEFPGVSFELPELGQVTLIEPQAVSVNNAFMDVMQPVLGTIVSFICVLAFINTAERMVVAVVSGISYFHFLKGD